MNFHDLGMWVHVDGPASGSRASRLEFGASKPLWVRRERIDWLGLRRRVTLLYASDLHLGGRWSHRIAAELVAAARMLVPDLILLGGDLADSCRGLHDLHSCVEQLSKTGPVWGVAGNHDRKLGIGRVRCALESGGGRWLGDEVAAWTVAHTGTIHLHGSVRSGVPDAGISILCAHDPAVFPEACHAGYRLVLAGHLHGSQCVWCQRDGLLYPGAWFFRWNGLRFSENGCRMFVSRGMCDTLPLRWNCPREVLYCEIGPPGERPLRAGR